VKLHSRKQREKRSSKQQSLRPHRKLHSPACKSSECGKGSQSSQSGGGKPFECTVCGKRFSAANYLRVHSSVHTSTKRHVCDVCHKAFRQASQLKNHSRVHTKEKPFNCLVCSKSFIQAAVLNAHMRLHTGLKPYRCTVCQKTFRQATILNNHMRIHTGERPYKCPVCPRAFIQSAVLNSHMRIHAEDITTLHFAEVTCSGQQFQMREAATGNAVSPTVDSRIDGMICKVTDDYLKSVELILTQ